MSLRRFDDDHVPDEETPFLPDQEVPPDSKPSRTPLPIVQISILLTAWLAESIISNSISPYLNQLVRELPDVGGDARKVGYYTGIIVSLRYAAEAATSFQWNRLSDHVGRKPVLLSCLVGTTLSILLFGLSRSFWALALSRCLHGAVMGHIGVVKSMTAELTDETNAARGFSMPPVAWSLGYVIGPLIGGILSRPQDRWPHIFSHPFWADYPYFLPCLVAAAFACLSLVITRLYLEETLNSRPSEELQLARPNSSVPQGDACDSPDLAMTSSESNKPLPLRSVLTKPVVVTTANYAMLALLYSVAGSYIPLVWSTPVEYGGLNLNPASIGLWLSVYGGMGGFFQLVFFSHFVSRFGLRRVFVFSIASCAVIYALFPFENLAVAGGGPNFVVWLLIILQVSSLCIFDMGYGAMNMYVSSAAPNRRSLGTVNGLSHVANSVVSAVGPAAADWLFAFSLTHNILGGKFAYIVLLGVVCGELGLSTQLPKNTWARRREE
ncbi:MFS general substrate transporter [Lactarius akahatsu]|uniref:MFS general substrate transporter n=1 Tax=Lactarius akahatsu TaxID=416441 RepID=A0AAD4LAU2_9AGAM|nr:MFS general substrate transporter [Lactarius akahatsu]